MTHSCDTASARSEAGGLDGLFGCLLRDACVVAVGEALLIGFPDLAAFLTVTSSKYMHANISGLTKLALRLLAYKNKKAACCSLRQPILVPAASRHPNGSSGCVPRNPCDLPLAPAFPLLQLADVSFAPHVKCGSTNSRKPLWPDPLLIWP